MLNYHLTLFDVKKNTIIFKIEILLYFSNLHKFILYLFYIYICYNWTIINTIKSFIYLRLIKSVRQSELIILLPDTFLNILKEYFLSSILLHLSKLIKQLLFDIINLITK